MSTLEGRGTDKIPSHVNIEQNHQEATSSLYERFGLLRYDRKAVGP